MSLGNDSFLFFMGERRHFDSGTDGGVVLSHSLDKPRCGVFEDGFDFTDGPMGDARERGHIASCLMPTETFRRILRNVCACSLPLFCLLNYQRLELQVQQPTG